MVGWMSAAPPKMLSKYLEATLANDDVGGEVGPGPFWSSSVSLVAGWVGLAWRYSTILCGGGARAHIDHAIEAAVVAVGRWGPTRSRS